MTFRIRPSVTLLSVDFFSKPRNRKFLAEFGANGIIALQVIWAAISQERNCELESAQIKHLAIPFLTDFAPTQEWLEKLICAAVEIGLLEQSKDKYFNSKITKLSKILNTYAAQIQQDNSRRKFTAQNKNTNGANSEYFAHVFFSLLSKDPILLKSKLKQERDTSRISKKRYLKQIDLTSEEKGGAKSARKIKEPAQNNGANSRGRPAQIPTPTLPDDLATAQNAFDEFVQYRKKVKKKPVTQRVADKLFSLYRNEPVAFKTDLLESIDNGWIRLKRQFSDEKEFATTTGANSKPRGAKSKLQQNLENLFAGASDE